MPVASVGRSLKIFDSGRGKHNCNKNETYIVLLSTALQLYNGTVKSPLISKLLKYWKITFIWMSDNMMSLA